MEGHVLSQIGLHAVGPDDPCGSGLHLHLSPVLLEPDGHLDFGVLGVFLDMASSQAGPMRPFLHADISIHRIARPRGEKLLVDVRALRTGGRTSIVQIEAFDELGTRVADSSQQMVFMKVPPEFEAERNRPEAEAGRRRFMAQFDGTCTLAGRLHDIIGITSGEGDDGTRFWTMPIGPTSRNGFGGLHGGVAFDLVTEAAVGAATETLGPVDAQGALLRYLAPAMVGPFRAVPTVMPQDDGSVFVRVEVFDDGSEALLCILGEVHLARRA
jgi:acyl-coenzyme A thioesterase PaaI-like protein